MKCFPWSHNYNPRKVCHVESHSYLFFDPCEVLYAKKIDKECTLMINNIIKERKDSISGEK